MRLLKAVQMHFDLFNILNVVSLGLLLTDIILDFTSDYKGSEEKKTVRGYLLLVSYLGLLNFFSAFKACRDSIDLI